jgi:hypothetical protein
MIFNRIGKYYEESKEGYTVCATRHADQWKFTAWHGKAELISVHTDSQQARDACAEHYREKNK